MNPAARLSLPSSQAISVYDSKRLQQLSQQREVPGRTLRWFRNALFKHFADDATALARFPASDAVRLHDLQLHQRRDSEVDGASKLLLRTASGMLIETVILRIASGRTTLCVSSQIGCAAACEFCATGKMGIARNLSTAEILDQVLQAGQILAAEGRAPRNIVFMGMGEPLHNESQLHAALQTLTASEYFHFPPSKILVSTVGVADAMLRLAHEFPTVNLALSLHSVRQSVREQLMPLARRYPLDQLRSAIEDLNQLQRCSVMIEYLMLAGINDSCDDAGELIQWLRGLNVHVNLIPFNAIDQAPRLSGSDRATRDAFAATLKRAGLKTTVRHSLGSDIAAACGQLVQHENRRIAPRRQSCEGAVKPAAP